MESLNQNPEKNKPQEGKFDVEKVLSDERGVLEKFKGKAKQVANAMLFVTALTAGLGTANEAYADSKSKTKTESSSKAESSAENIDESNLTDSSKWSRKIVESAKVDLKKVKTAEDAEWLVRTYYKEFVREFYFPTKGKIKEGAYGTKTRDYTEDDAKLIMQEAKKMQELVKDLYSKFGIKDAGESEQLDDIIVKSKLWSSYAWRQQQKALEDYDN